MYFTDAEHKKNFDRLVVHFNAQRDPEYKVACYIVAVPEIFGKIGSNINRIGERPFNWTFAPMKDENDDSEEEQRSEAYGVLSSGYRKLVDLGMNLYSSTNEFNLMDALGTWDDTCFNLYQQAVEIRINRSVSKGEGIWVR